MKRLLVLLLGLSTSALAQEACSPAREFITFMEYMRSKSEWKVPEKARRELAGKVAIQCPGSAARVIRVTSLLSEAGVGSKDALATGIRFAPATDEVADRFTALFKQLYLEGELDLDVYTSHHLATELSVDFLGSLPAVDREFSRLVRFCVKDTGLAQSRARCARFAADLLTAAREQGAGVASRFEQFYEFLSQSSQGPTLPAQKALALGEQVCGASEKGPDSFMEGYRYALSKKGLGQSMAEAVEFARDLVVNQIREAKLKTSAEVQEPEKAKPAKS